MILLKMCKCYITKPFIIFLKRNSTHVNKNFFSRPFCTEYLKISKGVLLLNFGCSDMQKKLRRLNGTNDVLQTNNFFKKRNYLTTKADNNKRNKKGESSYNYNFSTPWYAVAAGIGMFGIAWAAVPLYQIFCQSTGYDGTTQRHNTVYPPPKLERDEGEDDKKKMHSIEVDFTATIGGNMPWEFRPTQKKLKVIPGETALAFFTAKNLTDRPIIGMSVYSVLPPEVGIYFNKIQCFCFEEQMLNPKEEIDMPVFFFLDPEITKDPRLSELENITLSYIFFESNSEIPPEYKDLPFAQKTTQQPQIMNI